MENEIRFSVIILSYNSEKTVIDTLESISNQSYKNYEVILADDCSTDNTLNIVRNWINDHNEIEIKILSNDKNLGVTLNLQNAIENSKGTWIKPIAADDLLLSNCLEVYDDYLKVNNEIFIVQSNMFSFQKDKNNIIIDYLYYQQYKMKKIKNLGYKEQLKVLLYEDITLSPTLLINRNKFFICGGVDKRIRNIEDYPIKIKFLINGYKIGYLDEYTVAYRIHNSISRDLDSFYNIEHLKQKKKLRKEIIYPLVKKYNFLFWLTELSDNMRDKMIIYIIKNKKCDLSLFIQRFFSLFSYSQWKSRIFKWCYLKNAINKKNEKLAFNNFLDRISIEDIID